MHPGAEVVNVDGDVAFQATYEVRGIIFEVVVLSQHGDRLAILSDGDRLVVKVMYHCEALLFEFVGIY